MLDKAARTDSLARAVIDLCALERRCCLHLLVATGTAVLRIVLGSFDQEFCETDMLVLSFKVTMS